MHRSHEELEGHMNTGIEWPMPLVDVAVNPLQAEVERLTRENEELQAMLDESDRNFWKVVSIANRAIKQIR